MFPRLGSLKFTGTTVGLKQQTPKNHAGNFTASRHCATSSTHFTWHARPAQPVDIGDS